MFRLPSYFLTMCTPEYTSMQASMLHALLICFNLVPEHLSVLFLFFVFISVSVFQHSFVCFLVQSSGKKSAAKPSKYFSVRYFKIHFIFWLCFYFVWIIFFFCLFAIERFTNYCVETVQTHDMLLFFFFCWVICFEPKAHTTIED